MVPDTADFMLGLLKNSPCTHNERRTLWITLYSAINSYSQAFRAIRLPRKVSIKITSGLQENSENVVRTVSAYYLQSADFAAELTLTFSIEFYVPLDT